MQLHKSKMFPDFFRTFYFRFQLVLVFFLAKVQIDGEHLTELNLVLKLDMLRANVQTSACRLFGPVSTNNIRNVRQHQHQPQTELQPKSRVVFRSLVIMMLKPCTFLPTARGLKCLPACLAGWLVVWLKCHLFKPISSRLMCCFLGISPMLCPLDFSTCTFYTFVIYLMFNVVSFST